jgi:hypothetical protein
MQTMIGERIANRTITMKQRPTLRMNQTHLAMNSMRSCPNSHWVLETGSPRRTPMTGDTMVVSLVPSRGTTHGNPPLERRETLCAIHRPPPLSYLHSRLEQVPEPAPGNSSPSRCSPHNPRMTQRPSRHRTVYSVRRSTPPAQRRRGGVQRVLTSIACFVP